jgi:hypothetical protein
VAGGTPHREARSCRRFAASRPHQPFGAAANARHRPAGGTTVAQSEMARQMTESVRERHYLYIFRRSYLLCIFSRRPLGGRPAMWIRTSRFRTKVNSLLASVLLCPVHQDLPDGCFCPSDPAGQNSGQSSHFMISVIKGEAVRRLRHLMSQWPEFRRWRNYMDGGVQCAHSGVEITATELYVANCCYDEDLVAQHISTFDCS